MAKGADCRRQISAVAAPVYKGLVNGYLAEDNPHHVRVAG